MILYVILLTFLMFSVMFYKIYDTLNYRFNSLLKLLSASYFLIITVIATIMEFSGFVTDQSLNFQVIAISGVLFLFVFTSLFNHIIFGRRSKLITDIAMFMNFLILGIILIETILQTSILINIRTTNGNKDLIFHPLLLALLSVTISLLILGVFLGAVYQNEIIQSYSLKKMQLNVITVSVGIFAVIGIMFLDPGITTSVSKLITLVALLTISSPIFHIIRSIWNNPLTNIYLESSSKSFLDNDIVSYVLFANKDRGPEILEKSDNFVKVTNISNEQLMIYGLQSVSMAYNESSFTHNVSLSPFMGKREYFIISLSFVTSDNELTDERLKNQAFSIFSIFIPTTILYLFNQPLFRIRQLNDIMMQYLNQYQSIYELTDIKILNELTLDLLDEII